MLFCPIKNNNMSISLILYASLNILVLLLYALNWSAFSLPLDPSLLVFILLSSIIASFSAFLMRKQKFNLDPLVSKTHNTIPITICIVIIYSVNFAYGESVPLLYQFGLLPHNTLRSLPTIWPFAATFSIFYSFLLFYYFYSSKKKRYLLEFIAIISCNILYLSRSTVAFTFIGCLLIVFLLKWRKVTKTRRIMFVISAIAFLFIVAYVFGALGNLRQGYSINDSSYIENLGLFHAYPSWIPKQFMWIYLYLVTPLANLNYNVIQNNHIFSPQGFISTIIPEFISNRFQTEFTSSIFSGPILIKSYFNARTTFAEAYYSLGILGCYLMFFIMLALNILFYFLYKNKAYYNPVPCVSFCIFFSLFFFEDIFYYIFACAPLYYGLIMLLLQKKKRALKITATFPLSQESIKLLGVIFNKNGL